MAQKSFNHKQNQQHKATTSNGGKLNCQVCHKPNHSTVESNYRYEHAYEPKELPQVLDIRNFHEEHDLNLYADSRATTHMINNPGMISKLKPYNGKCRIYIGNDEKLNFSHVGNLFKY